MGFDKRCIAKHTPHLTGAQWLAMSLHAPLLLWNLVTPTEQKMLLALSNIAEFSLKLCIDESMLDSLAENIDRFSKFFVNLFSAEKFSINFHLLSHFRQQTERLGIPKACATYHTERLIKVCSPRLCCSHVLFPCVVSLYCSTNCSISFVYSR